ncbi:hypothetical protein QQ045_001375 [Rhodiola kirilowii]
MPIWLLEVERSSVWALFSRRAGFLIRGGDCFWRIMVLQPLTSYSLYMLGIYIEFNVKIFGRNGCAKLPASRSFPNRNINKGVRQGFEKTQEVEVMCLLSC